MRRFVRRGCGEGITTRNRRYTYSPLAPAGTAHTKMWLDTCRMILWRRPSCQNAHGFISALPQGYDTKGLCFGRDSA